MSIIKRATILIITAAAALFSVLPVYAEEDAGTSSVLTEESSDVSTESSSPYDSKFDKYTLSGDYRYSIHEAEDGSEVAFLERYVGNDTDVVLPETIDGYKVTGLGDETFYHNFTVQTITISATIEDFGYFPFYGCTALTEFKVDEKNELYETDSEGALVGKQGLLYLAYPIGKHPESVTIPDGFVVINASAFGMCQSLKEVKLPNTLEYTGDFAFSECSSLKSIEIPESVTELRRFSFSGCSSLESVKFSSNLQVIGDAAFFKCEKLETVDLPESLLSIGQAAFCASGLTSVTIPASVSSIGYSAFGYYTDLTNEILQNTDFVVMGYANSGAQTYCSENAVNFVAIDEGETEAETAAETTEEQKKKSGITPGMIVGICIIGAVLIVLIIVLVIRGSKNKNIDEAEEYDDDSSDTGDE